MTSADGTSPMPGDVGRTAPEVPSAAGQWTAVIDAAQPWNRTGIHLQAGVRYEFRAEGEWWDAQNPSGPDGYASPNLVMRLAEFWRRERHARWFALIGALDEDPQTQFVIGASARYTPGRSGELTCYANDWSSKYKNNRGKLALTVRQL